MKLAFHEFFWDEFQCYILLHVGYCYSHFFAKVFPLTFTVFYFCESGPCRGFQINDRNKNILEQCNECRPLLDFQGMLLLFLDTNKRIFLSCLSKWLVLGHIHVCL